MTILSDNADARLTRIGMILLSAYVIPFTKWIIGRAMGAVTDGRWSAFETTCAEIEHARNLLQGVSLSPQAGLSIHFYDRL